MNENKCSADTSEGEARLLEKSDDDASEKTLSLKSANDIARKYVCRECKKEFVQQRCLVRHMMKHDGKKPWKCSHCGQEFAYAVKFKKHCMLHGIEKPFQCEKCHAFFTTMEVLRVHDRVHTGERPFACDTCGQRFKQRSNLQDHMRKHKNERAFVCGTCSKSFNLKGDLAKHLLRHSGTKPFSCPHCAKTFLGVNNLNRHIRTHTGEKPFTCSHCSKSFARAERLKEHERTHTGERPFVCQTCGKTFSDSGNFSNHKKGHLGPECKKWRRFPKNLSSKGNFAVDGAAVGVSVEVKSQEEKFEQRSPVMGEEGRQQITLSLPNPFVCYLDQANSNLMMCYVGKSDCEAAYSDSTSGDQSLFLQLQNVSSESPGNGRNLLPSSKDTVEKKTKETLQTDSVTDPSATSPGKVVETDSILYSDSLMIADDNAKGIAISTPSKILSVLRPLYNDTGLSIKSPEKPADMLHLLSLQKDLSNSPSVKSYFAEAQSTSGFIITDISALDGNQEEGRKHQESGNAPVIVPDRDIRDPSTSLPDSGHQGLMHSLNPSSHDDAHEHVYASALTLTDLTKADESHGYNYQPGYIMLSDGDGEERKFGEILLATPTKSDPDAADQSSTAFICSQVLITPEHASHRRQSTVDRSKVKPRALEL